MKNKKYKRKLSVAKKHIDEYDDWNRKRYEERTGTNIFPIGISDREFAGIVTKLLLGDDWYVSYPAGTEQVNEEALEEIIYMFTHMNPNERDELRNKKHRS